MEMDVFGRGGRDNSTHLAKHRRRLDDSERGFRMYNTLGDLYFGQHKKAFIGHTAIRKLDIQCAVANAIHKERIGDIEIDSLQLFDNIDFAYHDRVEDWKQFQNDVTEFYKLINQPGVSREQLLDSIPLNSYLEYNKTLLCGEGHTNTDTKFQYRFCELATKVFADLQRNIELYEKYKALSKEKRAAIYKDRIDRWTAGVDSSFYDREYISFITVCKDDSYVPSRRFKDAEIKSAIQRGLNRLRRRACGAYYGEVRAFKGFISNPEVMSKLVDRFKAEQSAGHDGAVNATVSYLYKGFSTDDLKNTRKLVDNYLRYRAERLGLQLEMADGDLILNDDFSFDVRYNWEKDVSQKDRLIKVLKAEGATYDPSAYAMKELISFVERVSDL